MFKEGGQTGETGWGAERGGHLGEEHWLHQRMMKCKKKKGIRKVVGEARWSEI